MEDFNIDWLLPKAKEALTNAYAPYSSKANGAALLSNDDRVFTGCNIEIAGFASGVCAAKAALIKAVTEGARSFKAIAVAGEGPDSNYLCGECRQALAEFSKDTIVVSDLYPGKTFFLYELLPIAFEVKRSE